MAYYLHHVPGRIRVKIPNIKHRPYKADRVREMLQEQSGIDRIHVNLSTGSVVVYYDPEKTSAAQILNLLKYNDLIDEPLTSNTPDDIDRVSSRACEVFGKAIFGWTVGQILNANGLSFLAAFI
jgi:copper chaperone CopZ